MEIYRGPNSLVRPGGLLELGLEGFRRTMCVDGWEIRGRDPRAKSPHINPVQTVLGCEYFSPLFPFLSPPLFCRRIAKCAGARIISSCLFYF